MSLAPCLLPIACCLVIISFAYCLLPPPNWLLPSAPVHSKAPTLVIVLSSLVTATAETANSANNAKHETCIAVLQVPAGFLLGFDIHIYIHPWNRKDIDSIP